MNELTALYMFAVMPPEELAGKIHNERLNFSGTYGFVKALKPPVHITLYEPFKLTLAEASPFEKSISALQAWADRKAPFRIELKDYNYFDNTLHPVLYIDVVKNEALKELQSGLRTELKQYIRVEKRNNTYHPHVTVGYRDVKPEIFPAIRVDYSRRRFRETFECSSFFLWKHMNGNWQVFREFAFNNTREQLSFFS
jgi:2'-5' RNA ligase